MAHRFLKPDKPFDVRRWPGYYGWTILFFGTLGMIAAVPGSPPGMSVFIDGMIVALDMSRADFALAYTLGTITAGLAAPFAGKVVDRWGARATGCLSFFALGLILVYTGSLDHIHAWTGAGAVFTWMPYLLVFIAFAGIRLAGVSFAMTTCRSMVFRWFEGRRGWAAAVNGVVLSLSFSSAPLLLNGLIVRLDWQMTWIAIGILFMTVMTALAYVFFRDSPEDCGVEIEQAPKTRDRSVRIPIVRDFTGPEAVRTRAFWILASGLALNALIGTGVSFHIVAIAAGEGLGRSTAVAIFLPIAIFHVSTTLLLGAISEKIKLKFVLMLMIAAQTVALLGIANLGDPMWKWVHIVGSGVGWGCFGVMINLPWARFFGRKHLGAINGWVTGVTVITSALGPYFFGLSAELTGSFTTAIALTLILCPLCLIAAIFADNPQARFLTK
ncbi:MAG: MFS transporter [Puniceicoccaceae bacterium]|nr:MAG: MFS transporter [Puniceicoccaceae bacterium]